MKLLKLTILSLFFSIAVVSCNTEQHNNDVVESSKLQKTNADYTLEEILQGMRTWETLRTVNKDQLAPLLSNVNSFNLDVSKFPQGIALNAYACVLNGELKFAVISELYDNIEYKDNLRNYLHIVDATYADIATLTEETYESYTFSLPTQYIEAVDALGRIEDWNSNYAAWVADTSIIYQGFNIPTYDLQPQTYKVYLALKPSENGSDVKVADLVLDNTSGMFYDTVTLYPPFTDRTKKVILDLM